MFNFNVLVLFLLFIPAIAPFRYGRQCQRISISTFTNLCPLQNQNDLVKNQNFKFAVWDNVFDASSLHTVDEAAKKGGLSHTLYDRQHVKRPRNAIESAIESVLTQLHDPSRFVEYWWRDEWINLEAHADVDEALAKAGGGLRYPVSGHVLYLSVGASVRGPTVLFLNPYQGSMVVVPAASSRLLRFTGDLVHAVPRPPLAYLDMEEGGTNHELWTRVRRIDGVVSEETTVYRRSVLLFNTWAEPPLDVSSDAKTVHLITTTCTSASTTTQEDNGNEESISRAACHPKATWVESTCLHYPHHQLDKKAEDVSTEAAKSKSDSNISTTSSSTDLIRVKIGLLGDKERRGQSLRNVELLAPRAIRDTLSDAVCVSSVDIYLKDKPHLGLS